MPEGLINVNGDSVQTLEILFFTTILTLLPSILIMMTSFTRIIISLSFLRTAMGTQQNPPNMVLIGFVFDAVHYESGFNGYQPKCIPTICTADNHAGGGA